MKKDSFILYADAYDSIRSLPLAQKGQLLDAIFLFQLGENIPKLEPVVEMAFSFLRRNFERDAVKYAERCEKARESARKRWDTNACERKKRNAKHADTVPDPVPAPENEPKEKEYSASGDAVPKYQTKKGRVLKGDALELFNHFWTAFDYKKGKAEAADVWYDLKPTVEQAREIYMAALFEASRRSKLEANGQTPKMAQGWLSGRRWEDEINTEPPKRRKFNG